MLSVKEVTSEIKPYNKHKSEQNNISCRQGSIAEAMETPANQLPIKIIAGVITAVILLVVGGFATQKRIFTQACGKGMQRIDGKCIDPYRKGYEKLAAEGDKILEKAGNYQNLEELQSAQKELARVVGKLSLIPLDAIVYGDAKAKLAKFDLEQARIFQLIQTETAIREASPLRIEPQPKIVAPTTNFKDPCAVEPQPANCIF